MFNKLFDLFRPKIIMGGKSELMQFDHNIDINQKRGSAALDCIGNRKTLASRLKLNCSNEDYKYWLMYQIGIGEKICGFVPEYAFADTPTIYDLDNNGDRVADSEFATAANNLLSSNVGKAKLNNTPQINLLSTMLEADTLAGINEYGIILLIFNDGLSLSQPVRWTRQNTIAQAIPMSGYEAKAKTDSTDSIITHYEPKRDGYSYGMVHPSRVIHITDNGLKYHTPRIKNVLYDATTILDTVLASWIATTSDTPKVAITFDSMAGPQNGVSPDERVRLLTVLQEQARKVLNELDSVILSNGNTQLIRPEFTSPAARLEAHYKNIAVTKNIPWRLFVGNEAGQLASSQDLIQFQKRIAQNQNLHITPHIIQPTISTLIAANALPKPSNTTLSFAVVWPEDNTEKINLLSSRLNTMLDARTKALETIHLDPIDEIITLTLNKLKQF